MWSLSSIVLAFIALGSLSIAAVGTTTDQRCLEACSDYSGSLNFCRDAFDFKPQSQDIGFATEHVKCMCDGSRGDGNLGSEKMKASISTCLGCGITPNVIRDNLDQLTKLCDSIASGSASEKDILAFAPFGYSVLIWDAEGRPNAQGPGS